MIPLGVMASGHVPATVGGGTYRDEVLADNPFLYYPLDDATTPTDVTGTTTATTYANLTLGAPGIGDGATAASVGGGASPGGLSVGGVPVAYPGGFTIELLAAATNMTATRAIFEHDEAFLLRHASASLVSFTGAPAWPNALPTVTETAPTATHHYALTHDPGTATATLYRDGIAIATDPATGSASAGAAAPLVIGGRRYNNNDSFLGRIAGVALHTTALSPARILAHAQAAGVA